MSIVEDFQEQLLHSKVFGKYTREEFEMFSVARKIAETQDFQMKMAEECFNKRDYQSLFMYGNFSMYGYTNTDMLEIFYRRLPNSEKFQAVLSVYTNAHDCKRLAKYIKDIKTHRPLNYADEVQELADRRGDITIYRGCKETIDRVGNALSWTTNQNVAKWFALRRIDWQDCFVYSGKINIKSIIAYDNGRDEREILQYRRVRQIKLLQPEHFKTQDERQEFIGKLKDSFDHQ